MDVDLSTDLDALLPLVAPLISGHSDIAIGTRLHRGSRVIRGPKREFISRCYNLILRGALAAHFSDAQCGFKAIRADVAQQLLPLVQDNGWFFDTELLILAERSGLRIHEVPVDWVDDPDSRVDIVSTAKDDLHGCRAGRSGAGQRRAAARRGAAAARPGPAGAGDPRRARRDDQAGGPVRARSGRQHRWPTCCCSCCCTPWPGAQLANFLALALTAVGNTAANRRLTFGVRGRAGAARHQFQGFGIFLLGLAHHQRIACPAASRRPASRATWSRSSVLVGGQPGGHRGPVPAAARLGLPGPAAAADHAARPIRTSRSRRHPVASHLPAAPSHPRSKETHHDRTPDRSVATAPTRRAPAGDGRARHPRRPRAPDPGDGATPRGRWARLVLGPPGDPRWARPALWALLAATAVLYLWNLSASGYANDYYAAAVKSGTESWKAWLFGSLDSGNSITVDKPPASLWVMVLSGRIFGFSSFAMLAPAGADGRRHGRARCTPR